MASSPLSQRVTDESAPEEPAAPSGQLEGTVTVILGNKRISVPRHVNETLLESARRGGLAPPFSCEAGNCGTCMAKLVKGTARMRVNDALDEDDIEDGYILTCQGVPDSESVTVRYE
ncbi:2Fe-2S iron-sulfur cluster-binding protein [Nocardia callitridis]|uniref:2Fe-2S iron-sulfur cluster-binding protein n=1 Tax=Nocardia callitridis TaxID=648753 RepID=A0ABP9K6D0_9NOCA